MPRHRIFIDTEFTDFSDLGLISIAFVSEDGAEFYGVVDDFDHEACGDFARKYVLPQLSAAPHRILSRERLRAEVAAWLEQFKERRPCLCYDDFSDVALYRELVQGDVPEWLTLDNIYRKIDTARKKAFWRSTRLQQHHALHDARANRFSWRRN